jgi:hypothetical protein
MRVRLEGADGRTSTCCRKDLSRFFEGRGGCVGGCRRGRCGGRGGRRRGLDDLVVGQVVSSVERIGKCDGGLGSCLPFAASCFTKGVSWISGAMLGCGCGVSRLERLLRR